MGFLLFFFNPFLLLFLIFWNNLFDFVFQRLFLFRNIRNLRFYFIFIVRRLFQVFFLIWLVNRLFFILIIIFFILFLFRLQKYFFFIFINCFLIFFIFFHRTLFGFIYFGLLVYWLFDLSFLGELRILFFIGILTLFGYLGDCF